MTPVSLPNIAAEDASVHVSCWLADLGDDVIAGDRLVEVSTGGITFDVSAPASGRLKEIARGMNSQVVAGDVLGWLAADGGDCE